MRVLRLIAALPIIIMESLWALIAHFTPMPKEDKKFREEIFKDEYKDDWKRSESPYNHKF